MLDKKSKLFLAVEPLMCLHMDTRACSDMIDAEDHRGRLSISWPSSSFKVWFRTALALDHRELHVQDYHLRGVPVASCISS
jgi:hypothetical protein